MFGEEHCYVIDAKAYGNCGRYLNVSTILALGPGEGGEGVRSRGVAFPRTFCVHFYSASNVSFNFLVLDFALKTFCLPGTQVFISY